jgi:hypothetical protein
MSQKEIHEDGKLKLEIIFDSQLIMVRWFGESKEREPIKFINPVFDKIYVKDSHSPLILDFTNLEYMNSSTVTPIVKQIERAKKQGRKLEIRYKKGLKWQELSFAALRVFVVPNQIEVNGI